jgi:hypothetical protein
MLLGKVHDDARRSIYRIPLSLLCLDAAWAACDPIAASGVNAVCSGTTVNQNNPFGYSTGNETDANVTVLWQAAGRTVAKWHQEQFFARLALALPVRRFEIVLIYRNKAAISFVGLIAINRCLIGPVKGC